MVLEGWQLSALLAVLWATAFAGAWAAWRLWLWFTEERDGLDDD